MPGLLPAAYEPSRLLRGAPVTWTAYVSMDEDLPKTSKEIGPGAAFRAAYVPASAWA